MTMLIYHDDKSHRFWSVEQEQYELHFHWGKVGAKGQRRTKMYASDAMAAQEKSNLIKEKERNGYVVDTTTLTAHTPLDSTRPPWVSDLGLDDNGSLLLDFGPRQFTVGFDEALKPFVRDAQGRRLKDIPRPRKSDDPALSEGAIKRYKTLKKDARAIAKKEIQRLELAMCRQRRWPYEHFRQHLVEHPLIGHLSRHLVWGTYDANQQLTHCFRVMEDNTYSTANDDEFILPADTVQIGIPHRLEIPKQDAAGFCQLSIDYEWLPPFSQLDRPSYRLTLVEQASSRLKRWRNRRCHSGRLAGLTRKGWLRGRPQDAGWIMWMMKPMGDWTAILKMDGGLRIGCPPAQFHRDQSIPYVLLWKGDAHQYSDMTELGAEEHTFGEISEIAASELIHDIETLFS